MWEYIPFENCLEKTKIKFKLPKKDYRESGEYPIVSQEENLISGYHDDISYIFKVAKPIVVFGDHTLALKYIDFDFIVGADGVKILQPKKTINSKYFYYVLKALMPKTTGYARHYKLLKKLDIPVPPLEEQQRIVAKLDAAFAEIDEAVSLAQYKIADIQSLKNALLGSNLSNTKTTEKLGDVIEIARGGSPRPIKSFITTEDDGVNWIKIGDTNQGGKYISTTKEKIKPSGVSRSRYVKENDFLLSNSMSFGRPYILKTTGCIHDGWLVLSKYQESFIADYLYYLLSSSLVQNQFESLARGSTVRNLNIELVSQVIVPILPLTEQQRVVAKLDVAYSALEMANDAMEKSKRNYQALKSAILSKELQSSEAA